MKPEEHIMWQSSECGGYRAKVTIEWSLPDDVSFDMLPGNRKEVAEEIASSILSFSGPRMRNLVAAMRGYSSLTASEKKP